MYLPIYSSYALWLHGKFCAKIILYLRKLPFLSIFSIISTIFYLKTAKKYNSSILQADNWCL